MSYRLAQVNRLLQTQLGKALPELVSPNLLATVNRVETSPDLRQARVWISVLPDDDARWEELTALQPRLQAVVAASVVLKHTPRIELRRDQGPAHAAAIERLLESDRAKGSDG